MSAGDGYRYLLASVAAGDGNRSLTSPLIDYYTQTGTPPGYWLGAGIAGLGTEERQVNAGGAVSEQHLRRLLGQGGDPISDAPLGLPYYQRATVQDRVAARIGQLDADLRLAERAAAVQRIESEERERGTRRVVAGYDYTFSVPKSVSALWALADAATQAQIVQAHHIAIDEVIALMEREVAATRVGHNGVAQVGIRGLIATCYDHYDSRAGDPQLHTHVVIANKVQGADGKWRALDGRPMHAAVVALSEHYNALLADHLTRNLGVAWEQRGRGADRNAAWEFAGVPDRLLAEFSSRSAAIDAEKEALIAAYLAEHGHQPSTRTILRLRQQAALSTRPQKTMYSLAELSEQWCRRAGAMLGEHASTWAKRLLVASAEQAAPLIRAQDVTREDLAAIAQAVVEQTQAKRSTWRRWNLHAEASRQTMGLRFATTTDRETVVSLIADTAETASLRLTPPELTTLPAAFTRTDGSSVFRPRHAAVYTSAALLAAEDRLLELARRPSGPGLDRSLVDRVACSQDEQGRVLSADQRRGVEQIASSGRILDLLVGPAGAGKTLTLGALRRAWETTHGPGSVIGLAPSAAAAEVLAGELGIQTENTAKWVHEYNHDRWNFTAGQLVIVDEASLAGTTTIELLAAHAAEVGAKVLLAGDWAQLAAVDAGGAFGMLVRDCNNQPNSDPAPELADVRRFASQWEKSASLRLREGDTDVIDHYQENDRIVEGEHEQILDAAYHAWQADLAAGRASILIAENTETVDALNRRARADRVLAGQVSPEGVALHDGTVAGTGDTIVTRRNDRRLTTGRGWVKNGDQWTVLQADDDGRLTVRREGARGRRETVRLPASYVAEHVELGYAITAHRAQGATVETAHLFVHSSAMTREAFYVAMTRGRHSNVAYVATDEAQLEAHQHTPGFEDGQVTARSILGCILQHEGAERSAHETIASEQDAWTSIAQLAAEYETIAQAAQHDRFATAIADSGLDAEQVQAITGGESFGALVAQLRRTEADGYEPGEAVARVLRAGSLDGAKDPAAVLQARLARLIAARAGGTRPRQSPRYLAGLIPQATGPMPADMRRTLTELAKLIEQRADALTQQAIEGREPWVRRLGSPRSAPARHADWQRQLRTVAAYRDRYGLSGSDPLGQAAEQPGPAARPPGGRARRPGSPGRGYPERRATARARPANRHRPRPRPIAVDEHREW
jgi:conjugative relaxase-like TrwC/TraI family protein